jgi:hypothetical protein
MATCARGRNARARCGGRQVCSGTCPGRTAIIKWWHRRRRGQRRRRHP